MPAKQKDEKSTIILPFEFKAMGDPDEKGYVNFEGYAAAFDNVDLGNDVIVKGAFAETLSNDQTVPILLDHMAYMTETAGFNKSASEDERGLKVQGQLNTNVEAGKIAYQIGKQALDLGKGIGMSIGYGVIDKEYDPDTGIRTLKKLKLYEYSFTNFPMNPQATLTAIKSRRRSELKAALKELLAEEPGILSGTDDPEDMEPGEDKQVLKDLLSSIKNTTHIAKQR
jgi:HK97 family phage prohead protease